jgi:3-phosphoshikimate 1-carboxyvinyltransferase
LIYGKGLGSLHLKKNTKLNFGNSGTLTRLLVGILSTTPGIKVDIIGDNSLNKRSMKKLIDLMQRFGAFFLPKKKFNLPLKLISSEMPIGINYDAGVSAQLKSDPKPLP